MKHEDIIEKLRDDEQYYGDFGRQYISNSDIKNLTYDPAQFGNKIPDNPNFHLGRYFHQLILEPNKAKEFPIVDIKGRNTKAYKSYLEDNNLTYAITTEEAKNIQEMADYALNKDPDVSALIQDFDAKYEEPMVGEIFAGCRPFKAKADIISQGLVVDLKTTSDIFKFKRNAYTFGYDTQAFIYQHLFKMPMTFIVLGKVKKKYGTVDGYYFDMGVFPTTEEFVLQGKEKVELAMQNYEKYFSENATESIEDTIINSPL